MINLVESFIFERLPEPDPNVGLVNDIVSAIREDRTLIKVEDAVRQTGLHKRTLQRLFDRYVGVSPKWVIRRYRLHDAAERMEQGDPPDWLELSSELGYYDQSHFIRVFKSIVGTSPQNNIRNHE
ncbi:AraC family transcriptional regulator [Paenibacillus sp. JMULE4]|nr:AraC family transcriptional regulator [Paenibacillus sp. JMULE4]NTZ16755.1 AraC family transcriptional regulator [Paenibacillus sp. JMULE4]